MSAMGSETDSIPVDSDESLLDIKEINDLEFDIPTVAPQSLESVLWDMESEEGSDNISLHSLQSITAKFRSMLSHDILQGISVQIASAGERVNAGLPTCITNCLKYIAVGTSHGYIFAFDAEQSLCWFCNDTGSSDQGAVSGLAFNLDSTRLLIGYERGYVAMVDASTGDVIRKMPEAHAPQTAVLHLRFTFLNNLALVGDSSGCVFSLSFNRRLGVRTWDSKCLFSGARGEVCVFEPLIHHHDIHFLSNHVLVAMATLSKVIVISIKPRLKVHFSQQLPKASASLPLISWQLVSIGKKFQPVLAWGRANEMHYTTVLTIGRGGGRIRLLPLRDVVRLPYTLLALRWLGPRHLALLDTGENLRLMEVRSQRELEVLEVAGAGLVYSSAHFKALAVGGGVSGAFALAGERACYNSISTSGSQLLILGTKAVHLVKMRTWPERLLYLCDQGRWAEALNLAAEEGPSKETFTLRLLDKYLESLNQNTVDKDSLTAAINCCIKLGKVDILCDELLEAVSTDHHNQDWYYTLITDHICNGDLTTLSPVVSQKLVLYLEKKDPQLLENVLLSLDVACLDLNQVLKLCKKMKLYNAWIHIVTRTLGDYTGPLTEFLLDLTPDNNKLGNTMLVYVSSCLAGLGYPTGSIPDDDILRVKHDVLRCLETLHSINGDKNEPSYPYLRALLKYSTRECLNVVELAFTEAEFAGELGQLQRQRLIQILMQIVAAPEFSDSQIINLACFISRLVISNNLKIEEYMLEAIIKSLIDMSGSSLNMRDQSEREQAWLDLLQVNKLKHLKTEDMLKMALESRCYKVAEHLYELQKDYCDIFTCYLNDPVRKSEIFNYIQSYINVPERRVKEQFIVHFEELVTVSNEKTAEIVIDYFLDLLEQLCVILDGDFDLQYNFLSEIVASDTKLPPQLAEKYLEQVCIKDKDNVCNYVQLCFCRREEALEITQKYETGVCPWWFLPDLSCVNVHGTSTVSTPYPEDIPCNRGRKLYSRSYIDAGEIRENPPRAHAATALLLEQGGEWPEALGLLLRHGMVDEGVALCARGAEHLDPEGARRLWLELLRGGRSGSSPRRLVHAAAPHVPPDELLELVSGANFGDVKALLAGMLNDRRHDVVTLETTLKILGKDFHHRLAKSLSINGRGLPVSNQTCSFCQKSLSYRKELEDDISVSVWGCGHCFHSSCIRAAECSDVCPKCRLRGTLLPRAKTKVNSYIRESSKSNFVRPDLEGHF